MATRQREKFATQVDSAILADVRDLAKTEGRQLQALKSGNVELVTDPITQITKDGVSAGGEERHVDVLICATGFHTHESLAPIEVRGRGGKAYVMCGARIIHAHILG